MAEQQQEITESKPLHKRSLKTLVPERIRAFIAEYPMPFEILFIAIVMMAMKQDHHFGCTMYDLGIDILGDLVHFPRELLGLVESCDVMGLALPTPPSG